MPRQYKRNRAKRRTPYETYSYWYDQKTKTAAGKRKYKTKLTESEFYEYYDDARDAGVKNPAKTIAEKQRKIRYSFQKEYEEAMRIKLNDDNFKLKIENFETPEAREKLFLDFAENYDDTDAAREAFEDLY